MLLYILAETSAFESLYGGQFTLSTQLIKPSYLAYKQVCICNFVIELALRAVYKPSYKPFAQRKTSERANERGFTRQT